MCRDCLDYCTNHDNENDRLVAFVMILYCASVVRQVVDNPALIYTIF